jgi:hypothetical protein
MPRHKRSQLGKARRPAARTTYVTRQQDPDVWLRGVRNDIVGGGGRWRRPDPTTFRGLTIGS